MGGAECSRWLAGWLAVLIVIEHGLVGETRAQDERKGKPRKGKPRKAKQSKSNPGRELARAIVWLGAKRAGGIYNSGDAEPVVCSLKRWPVSYVCFLAPALSRALDAQGRRSSGTIYSQARMMHRAAVVGNHLGARSSGSSSIAAAASVMARGEMPASPPSKQNCILLTNDDGVEVWGERCFGRAMGSKSKRENGKRRRKVYQSHVR